MATMVPRQVPTVVPVESQGWQQTHGRRTHNDHTNVLYRSECASVKWTVGVELGGLGIFGVVAVGAFR